MVRIEFVPDELKGEVGLSYEIAQLMQLMQAARDSL